MDLKQLYGSLKAWYRDRKRGVENRCLDNELLITHGTYTLKEIIDIEGIKQRFLEKGEGSLSLDERIRLANFAYLTESYMDEGLKIFLFKEDSILRKLSKEIIRGIEGVNQELRRKMGYRYSPRTPESLFKILTPLFGISPGHKYIDVGCGHGTEAIDIFKRIRCEIYMLDPNVRIGCEIYMLDPNVINIRYAYHNLIKSGLAEDPRIKIILGTIQHANLQGVYFDRTYLGGTVAHEDYDTIKKIQEAAVRVTKDGGIIAIVHDNDQRERVSSEKMDNDGVRLTESYHYTDIGFIQIIKVHRQFTQLR